MSDLLNSASLVMIPSGYKEDVVYSQIPTDGSGDLSFTRASNGTRINSAGLVEVCPWNLAGYSEEFNNAYWAKPGATITANDTTAPNGVATADKVLANSGNTEHGVYNGTPFASNFVGEVYNYSVYAKKGTVDFLVLDHYQGSYTFTWFNLNTGTVGTVASGVTATIESVGNGWYRCSCTKAITATTLNFIGIYLSNANNTWSFNAAGTESIYIWGAMVNLGSTAKPYFPTTDRLNVPRLTYQNGGGGCPSLLLEPQSTNLVSYSQDFTNAYWSKTNQGVGSNAVITPNYTTSPDGTNNAFRLQCNLNGGTTSNDRSWMIANFTAPATSTLSIWIKLNSAGTKTFVFSDAGGGTKTISGTDWQRIDGTFVGAVGQFRIGLIGGSTSDTLDCSIWGAQAESGSYPTSYIPTTSSSATRVADECSKTGISSLIGQSEGVLFLDFKALAQDSESKRLTLSDGTLANRITLATNDNVISGFINVGNVNEYSFYESGINVTNNTKVAVKYAQNNFAIFINGVKYDQSTSGNTFASGTLTKISFDNALASNNMIGNINQVLLFPTALSDAELQALTTL